ncbi:MAG: hypothetical protein RL134_1852 [Actinomycetota bacterium]|jgi:hypothetical protein
MKSARPVLKIAAPFVVLAATWAADRALTAGYSAVTGKKPPNPDDRGVSFSRALAWTLATATTAAVIQLVIYRAAAKASPEDVN